MRRASIIPIGMYAAKQVNLIDMHIPPKKNASHARFNAIDLFDISSVDKNSFVNMDLTRIQ